MKMASVGVTAALVLIVSMAGVAQEPRFDVASIKRNVSGQGLPIPRFMPGGQLTANRMTVRELIRSAYAEQGIQMVSQVEGGPDWIGSDRFDIVAKVSADLAARSDFGSLQGALLRNLLADRFKLRVRMETRERPIYELVLARQDRTLGPQLKPSTCDRTGGAPAALLNGAPCSLRIGGPANITAEGVTMPELAAALSNFPIVERVVRDRTELPGAFDLQIKFVGAFTIGPGGTVGPPNPNADSGPNLFTALQEQLGLKLDASRGPVDVLVVDHVEPPTEN